jgi:ABC-type bacteriocin/lantibiotic exporters, contain an N-terminal double-glycine peptidase domain
VKLVLQRALGDCGLAALATLIEQSYEDVYVATAAVDKKARGRNGIHLGALCDVAKRLGVLLRLKRHRNLDEDEGLLVVTWAADSRHEVGTPHLVAVGHGVIVDPADGTVLPVDDYLTREKATAGSFLELQ